MRKWILLTASIVLLMACSSPPPPTPTSIPPTPTPVPRPDPEIVGRSASDSGGLFADAAVQVECEIRNAGDTGRVTVTAFVDAQNGAWTKRQTSVIGGGESREFIFDFPEVEYQLFSDNSYEYRCGWELP